MTENNTPQNRTIWKLTYYRNRKRYGKGKGSGKQFLPLLVATLLCTTLCGAKLVLGYASNRADHRRVENQLFGETIRSPLAKNAPHETNRAVESRQLRRRIVEEEEPSETEVDTAEDIGDEEVLSVGITEGDPETPNQEESVADTNEEDVEVTEVESEALDPVEPADTVDEDLGEEPDSDTSGFLIPLLSLEENQVDQLDNAHEVPTEESLTSGSENDASPSSPVEDDPQTTNSSPVQGTDEAQGTTEEEAPIQLVSLPWTSQHTTEETPTEPVDSVPEISGADEDPSDLQGQDPELGEQEEEAPIQVLPPTWKAQQAVQDSSVNQEEYDQEPEEVGSESEVYQVLDPSWRSRGYITESTGEAAIEEDIINGEDETTADESNGVKDPVVTTFWMDGWDGSSSTENNESDGQSEEGEATDANIPGVGESYGAMSTHDGIDGDDIDADVEAPEGIRFDHLPRLPKGASSSKNAKGPKGKGNSAECEYEYYETNKGPKRKKCKKGSSKKSKLHKYPLHMPGTPAIVPDVPSTPVAPPSPYRVNTIPTATPTMLMVQSPSAGTTSLENQPSSNSKKDRIPSTSSMPSDAPSFVPTQTIVEAAINELWVYADPIKIEAEGSFDLSTAKQVFFDSTMNVMETYLRSYLGQFLLQFNLKMTYLDSETVVVPVGITGSKALIKSYFVIEVDFKVGSVDMDLLLEFTKSKATLMVESFYKGLARQRLLDNLDELGVAIDVLTVMDIGEFPAIGNSPGDGTTDTATDGDTGDTSTPDEETSQSGDPGSPGFIDPNTPGVSASDHPNNDGEENKSDPESDPIGVDTTSGGDPNTALYAGVVSASVVVIAIVAVVYSTRRRKRKWFQDAVESVASSLYSDGAGPPDGKVLPVLTPTGTSTIRTGLMTSSPQSSQSSFHRKSRVKPAAITMRGRNAMRSQGSVSTLGSFNMTLNPVLEKHSMEDDTDSEEKIEEESDCLTLMEDGPDLVAGTSLTCLDNTYSFEGLTSNYPEFELYSGIPEISPSWSVDGLTIDGDDDYQPRSSRRSRWQDESSETGISRLPDHSSDLGFADSYSSVSRCSEDR